LKKPEINGRDPGRKSDMEEKRLLSVDEVADYLKIPKSTLYKMCSEREIPCAKIGKHWRFDKNSIDEWFVGKMQNPEMDGGPK
jgi:excisionase family DNA binding protein